MSAIQQTAAASAPYNDYHQAPVTEKQMAYARQIATRSGVVVPWEVQQNRYALSRWIDTHKIAKPTGQFSNYPTSKQVGFAERIARMKRREVPQECFRDREMMSKWIDANL
ncbi:hypothetical protein OA238_160p1250 (plasmid) [Octadecabacter arcticus 238]|jgi:hypothetical protein|uniref:Uncharacterized protein n=1 Tax=Octadecabacter arcticus 238 TaxID=391616 RepID=M9RYL2_9RHOB|nr:hypothetical protein [Octadecabacter arcticus]AGI74930.1 hypothetical protein OA238_160p1250 [Octadecabacter arcticus 238]